MTHIKMLAMTGATALCAGIVFADDLGTSINNLPDKGTVMLTGSVTEVRSNQEFTLRDRNGATININLIPNESLVFKEGDKVTVTGTVATTLFGLMGKHIDASDVQVHKDLGTTLSDAVTTTTGISVDQAAPAQIGKLPDQGMVKISGTVESITGAKNFTVKDSTGTINVNIQSDENVALIKDTRVTVVGYVHTGLLGKDIKATHVIVTTDASPQAETIGNSTQILQ